MAQSDLNVANADGATVRADINSQLEALVTQSSGATAPPVTFPLMRWFDTVNQQIKERNSANTAWRVVAEVVDGELVPYSGGESVDSRFVRATNIEWLSRAIGEPFPLWDNIAGVSSPPIDTSAFRFVRLTAGQSGVGGYNEGILTGESVTGSAPLVVATATISFPESPMDGQTINLINTERRFIRAGSPGSTEFDQMQRLLGTQSNVWSGSLSGTGVFAGNSSTSSNRGTSGTSDGLQINFDSANSSNARVSSSSNGETRPKNVGATYYMRIA